LGLLEIVANGRVLFPQLGEVALCPIEGLSGFNLLIVKLIALFLDGAQRVLSLAQLCGQGFARLPVL
jgi:hypothetical protein